MENAPGVQGHVSEYLTNPTARGSFPVFIPAGILRWWSPVLLLFFVPALALVLSNFNYSNPAYAQGDQRNVHLPAIEFFSNHWGKFDFKTYFSPNAPGYYILLGAVRHFVTSSVVGLRLFNLLLTAGLIVTLALTITRYCPSPLAVFLAMPFMFSSSVYPRGIWLLTDNPALWGILLLLFLALRSEQMTTANLVAIGFLTIVVVSIRQNQIWIVPAVLFAAFIGPESAPVLQWAAVRRTMAVAIAVAPAVLMIGSLILLWHGTVPPSYQDQNPGFSFAPLPMTFVLMALFGPFFLTAIWSAVKDHWTQNRAGAVRFVAAGLALGILAGLAPDGYFVPVDRSHGIWLLSRVMPLYFGHAPIIALLSVIGGIVLGTLWMVLSRRDRWVLSSVLFCFVAVQCFHRVVVERYYEPLLLMLLAVIASRVAGRSMTDRRNSGQALMDWRLMAAGPAMIAVVEASYTIWSMSRPATY